MKTKKRQRKGGRPDEKVLAEIVQRVVEAAQPDKIILFGSAARGEMGPNSDLDLLVIKGGKFNHWHLLTTIYRHLRDTEPAVDVVLVTPEEVEFRRTEYDFERAAAAIRESGYPGANEFAAENVLTCPTAEQALAVFSP